MPNSLYTSIKQNIDLLLITGIVLIGVVLRCYDYFGIPMTHDELSAIYRLDYSSFHELIENGVKQDGHPAGIQVFLYYWTKIFGTSDAIVKLPFMLMGIASIILSYIIAKKWFHKTSALIIASYIASLQFPIMYSQISRPYISGMFFCLLAINFWTNYFFIKNSARNLNLISFALALSLCAYNHHFSLLFAFIIYVSGLFFVTKKDILKYFGSGILILLLYLPHINIFLYQLNVQGLDWLGKPRNTFILEHIKFIFHFNIYVYICVFILSFINLYYQMKEKNRFNKFQIISIVWFLSSLLIGFFYSIIFKPVLQHSVLIFTFPFLLFTLFSFIKTEHTIFKIVIISSIIFINIYTLVYSRKHYEIFYKQPFNMFSKLTSDFLKDHNKEDVLILFSENPKYLNHYFKKENPTINYISTPDIGLDSIRKLARTSNKNFLICANQPVEHMLNMREFYPYLVYKDFGFCYEYYIFSKNPIAEKNISDIIYSQILDFEGDNASWSYEKNRILLDEKKGSVYRMDSTFEWGPSIALPLKDITSSRHNFIDISVEYKGASIDQGLIAFELLRKDSSIIWLSTMLQNYYDKFKKDDWQKAYFSFRLTNEFKHYSELEDCTLKVFIWNNKKSNVLLDNLRVDVREGNPKVYSLVEDFQE